MTTEVPPPSPTSSLRQLLLRLMLVLIGAGVIIAVLAVLRGEPLGETLAKIINTAVVTGIFGAMAIACADAGEQRPSLLSYVGVVASCVAVALIFVGIWTDASRSPLWWKAMTISSVYAVALWRATRFSLAKVQGPVASLIVRGTVLVTLLIPTVIAWMLLREQATPLALRVLNACLILCVGGHVAVPVLERMQRSG
ncbi:MAG: hypothetical protein IT383_23395 [Deltaproteobacteria bacterium]|nr:hypothetical protein [Deltaproteobacteria bacterium]